MSSRIVDTRALPTIVVFLWLHDDIELGNARDMSMVVHGAHKAKGEGVNKPIK